MKLEDLQKLTPKEQQTIDDELKAYIVINGVKKQLERFKIYKKNDNAYVMYLIFNKTIEKHIESITTINDEDIQSYEHIMTKYPYLIEVTEDYCNNYEPKQIKTIAWTGRKQPKGYKFPSN